MNTIRNCGLTVVLSAIGFAVAVSNGASAETRQEVGSADPVVVAAMGRGFDWMQAHQNPEGAWSDTNYPALTALGLWAFAGSTHPARTAVCDRAAAYIASFLQDDGGIYKKPTGGRGTGGLSVYNTAICLTALHAYDRQRYAAIILRARAFLASAQIQGEKAGSSAGGFGYERTPPPPPSRAEIEKRARARAAAEGMPEPTQEDIDKFVAMMEKRAGSQRGDLSNTGLSLMAMRLTQNVEDQRSSGEKHVDVDW